MTAEAELLERMTVLPYLFDRKKHPIFLNLHKIKELAENIEKTEIE